METKAQRYKQSKDGLLALVLGILSYKWRIVSPSFRDTTGVENVLVQPLLNEIREKADEGTDAIYVKQ